MVKIENAFMHYEEHKTLNKNELEQHRKELKKACEKVVKKKVEIYFKFQE